MCNSVGNQAKIINFAIMYKMNENKYETPWCELIRLLPLDNMLESGTATGGTTKDIDYENI